MNWLRFFSRCLVVGTILSLSSCAGDYKRNYRGPLQPIEEVAFIFHTDGGFSGQLYTESKEGRRRFELPKQNAFISLFSGPFCRELTPDYYTVEANRQKPNPSSRFRGYVPSPPSLTLRFRKMGWRAWDYYGPSKWDFYAQPGHIYSLKFVTRTTEMEVPSLLFHRTTRKVFSAWKILIRDVTSDDKYKGYLEKIGRK